MHRFISFVLLVSIICLSAVAFSQTSQEMITVPKSQLTPEQLKVAEAQQTMEQPKAETGKYSEFIGLGKAVGIGMREGLEALTDTADKFSKTDVGHFTMFLIAYRIIGEDFIQFLIGIPMFIACTIVIIWSYRRNCIPYRVKIKDDGWGKAKQWQLESPERAGNSDFLWGHFVAWLIATAVCAGVTFF